MRPVAANRPADAADHETRVHVTWSWEDPQTGNNSRSSILASKSRRREEPGGLLSTGAKSQTVLGRHADPSTVAPGPKVFPFYRSNPEQPDRLKHFILFYFNEIFIF